MSARNRIAQASGPSSVEVFYDTHPINEEQILGALTAKGASLERLTVDLLKEHDQDHFGGSEATDLLAAKAGLKADHLVLDVCSGLGGPARYLAHRIGCRVVGLDLNESRYRSAQRLTGLVGLEQLVSFRHGNALDMPFESATFDAAIGQEAWCHIPDKPRLIAECARVVKPGGAIAFTDILRRPALRYAEESRLHEEMTFSELASLESYADLLQANGCEVEMAEDLSDLWSEILVKRLAMYRNLREHTERRFGAEHFRRWDSTYTFFVGLFGSRKLGGGRFIARRSLT